MRRSRLFLTLASLTTAALLSGCKPTLDGFRATQMVEVSDPRAPERSLAGTKPKVEAQRPADTPKGRLTTAPKPNFTNLTRDLAAVARQLEQVAISQSPARLELRAARAQLSAAKFGRLPSISPTASAPLTSGSANAGVNLQQMIWDGGRQKARMGDAELSLAEASLNYWQERNDYISAGLAHLIEIAQYQQRLDVYKSLQRELSSLDQMLQTRAEGGVADRGERLRMNVAVQEIRREMVEDETNLRQATSNLTRLLRSQKPVRNIGNLQDADASCSRNWPDMEPPVVAMARITQEKTENNETMTSARQYPKINLGVGISFLSGLTAGFNLDSSDMLGLERKAAIASAQARSEGSRVLYVRSVDDIAAEFDRLDSDYQGYKSNTAQLASIIQANQETISLYLEQVEIGTIRITDGISIHRENANAKLDLIDSTAETLVNCITSSRLRGTISPFEAGNE